MAATFADLAQHFNELATLVAANPGTLTYVVDDRGALVDIRRVFP
jgi:hypothetical protein